MRKTSLTFQEFVDQSNRKSPLTRMLHDLGGAVGPIVDHRAIVGSRIDRVLMASNLNPEEFDSLRTKLMAAIKSEIKEPDGAEVSSTIDNVNLGLDDNQKVKAFLLAHGYDLDDDSKGGHLEYMLKTLKEAVAYYDEHIACKGTPKVHKELKDPLHKRGSRSYAEAICNFFKLAAGKGRKVLIPQACALLRIAFVIQYQGHNKILKSLPQGEAAMSEKIGGRISIAPKSRQPVLRIGGGDTDTLSLLAYRRREKLRDAITTKLLHKTTNRATAVLDGIGTYFETRYPIDTVKLIYFLFYNPDGPILPAMNINIKESKDILLGADNLRDLLEDEQLAMEFVMKASSPTFALEELTLREVIHEQDNPHSSSAYQAITIVFELMIDMEDGSRELVPCEIQIADYEANKRNWSEEAHHQEYKTRQKGAVRTRLFKHNLVAEYDTLFGKK